MPNTPSTTRTKFTPPQIAKRFGISADKVLAWIRSGELRAFNAATKANGRPRWLIDIVDVELFEQRRGCNPPQAPKTRKKRKTENVIEFF